MPGLLGMDVDAVRGVATKLDALTHALAQILGAVDGLARHASSFWLGPDAHEFNDWWTNQHKPALERVHEAMRELAQSARNNADEQERASNGTAPVAASATHGGSAPPVAAPSANGPTTSAATDGQSGGLPDSGGKAAYESTVQHLPTGYDQWGKVPDQCTSWAAFRRSELGLSIPYGHGGAMGHDSTLSPIPGAIASYGSGTDADPGHVMIVEQVLSPTRFRVSEMNYDLHSGYRDTQIWDKLPDGTWKSEADGLVRVIKFTL